MPNIDITGNKDVEKKLVQEKALAKFKKESFGNGEKNRDNKFPGKDELESDGSGGAFEGTEEVRE